MICGGSMLTGRIRADVHSCSDSARSGIAVVRKSEGSLRPTSVCRALRGRLESRIAGESRAQGRWVPVSADVRRLVVARSGRPVDFDDREMSRLRC